MRLALLLTTITLLALAGGVTAQQAPPPAGDPDAKSVEHPIQSGGAGEVVLFYAFGGLAAFTALGAVISTNIVRTATCLMGTLVAVACLYFLLGANFLGAIQLIVYAGGILILIVFGVMLTSRIPAIRLVPQPGEIIGGALVCLALAICLIWVLTNTAWPPAQPATTSFTIEQFGKGLLSDYLVPFEVASMLLLVVMVGAAYLARSEKQ